MSRRNPRQMLAIGPLSANSTTLPHYIPNGHTFTAPSRICNATVPSTDKLVLGERWSAPARPGSEDHRRYSSKGSI